jgi:hypothetical protein
MGAVFRLEPARLIFEQLPIEPLFANKAMDWSVDAWSKSDIGLCQIDLGATSSDASIGLALVGEPSGRPVGYLSEGIRGQVRPQSNRLLASR